MSSNNKKLAYLAFAMYFITGVICMLIGSSMSSLVEMYGRPIEKIVLFTGAFAIGRTLSVYLIGKAARKQPLKVLFVCTCMIMAYMLGLVLVPEYYLGFAFAFLGGVGMSGQDAVCPLFLSRVYPKSYSSVLSAGQALYGLGSFAISALIGLLFKIHLPFYLANYLLALVGVSMLVLIPFTRWEAQPQRQDEEMLKPLYANNHALVLGLLGLICFVYCSGCNSLGSFMSSYIESMGHTAETGSYMLAVYNLFIVIGSVVFVGLLKKINERTILVVNSLCITVALAIGLKVNTLIGYYVSFSAVGFFLGVLFTIIIAIGTRIEYRNISVVSALIAMIGSCGDIFTPFVTSRLVEMKGVTAVFYYVVVLMVIETIVSVCVYVLTKEEK